MEAKLTELGILTNYNYKVTFGKDKRIRFMVQVLDKTSMFKVTSNIKGKVREHDVKPLQFIWDKFPQYYNPRNTLHIDDLARNFALNPRNGIKVTPFKNAIQASKTDQELKLLAKYLKLMASVKDVTEVSHEVVTWMICLLTI